MVDVAATTAVRATTNIGASNLNTDGVTIAVHPPGEEGIAPQGIPTGFAFDPIQQLLQQLAQLLKQLQGFNNPGRPFPPDPPYFPRTRPRTRPPIDRLPPPPKTYPDPKSSVTVGRQVGYILQPGATPKSPSTQLDLKVEDVVARKTSFKEALAAAHAYSLRHGNEPVAIVETMEPLPIPASGKDDTGVTFMPGGQIVYTIVTLDPAIAPESAHLVQNFGGARITNIVQGNREQATAPPDWALPHSELPTAQPGVDTNELIQFTAAEPADENTVTGDV